MYIVYIVYIYIVFNQYIDTNIFVYTTIIANPCYIIYREIYIDQI